MKYTVFSLSQEYLIRRTVLDGYFAGRYTVRASREKCAYCGTTEKLTQEHIIPKSIHINDRCPQCDKIQAIHNMVFACKTCNRRKHTKGLYTFFHELYPDEKMSDIVPPLLEKKYLKLMYCCHQCAGTLE